MRETIIQLVNIPEQEEITDMLTGSIDTTTTADTEKLPKNDLEYDEWKRANQNIRYGDLTPSNWKYLSSLEDLPHYLDLYMTWVQTKPTNTLKNNWDGRIFRTNIWYGG